MSSVELGLLPLKPLRGIPDVGHLLLDSLPELLVRGVLSIPPASLPVPRGPLGVGERLLGCSVCPAAGLYHMAYGHAQAQQRPALLEKEAMFR